LRIVLTRYPRELFWSFLMMSGHNANVYILSAFSISYMTNTLHLSKTTALSALFISAWCAVVSAPIMGWLADKYNPAKIYGAAALFTVVYAFPLFMFIDSGNLLIITLGMSIAFIISYGAMAGPQGLLLARVFPTEYRYSGISVAREMNGMLVAGPTPLIGAFLVEIAGGKPTYVAVYLGVCCLLSAFAVYKLVTMRSVKRGTSAAPVVEG